MMGKLFLRNFLMTALTLFTMCLTATRSLAANEIILASCGSSNGKAYFFDGKGWTEDGISNGKIILVGNAGGVEGDFDIRFQDAFNGVRGQIGYSSDGAKVIQISGANGRFSFIAAHQNYTDQYTFDINRSEVVWTSHKVGTIVTKVGIYYAECLK